MLLNKIIELLNRRATKGFETKIDISTGTIYFKKLNNGMVTKAMKKSCILGSTLNNPYFYEMMDLALTGLSKKKYCALSYEDGHKIRVASKILMYKHGVLKELPEGYFKPGEEYLGAVKPEEREKLRTMAAEAKDSVDKFTEAHAKGMV